MKKVSALENVLGKLDDLDSASLAIIVQRLVRERRLLEMVFSTIREGILVIDKAGIIQYANPAANQLLGLAQRDIGRASLWKSVPDLAHSVALSANGTLESDAGVTREVELTYPEKKQVRLYIVPITDPEVTGDKGARRHVIILTDVTREKAETRETVENERINSILHLAAGVAHELGNPLNSINIHLQLLLRQTEKLKDKAAAAKLKASLDVCAAEVTRLDGIITHFLQAVRPTPPDFSEADLLALLAETLEFMGPELADAGIGVDIHAEARIPSVLADTNQIKQVFFNLLKNAREAMKSGGVIKVRARADDDYVYLLIADTGEGIPEENLSRIFLPYFTTKSTGTGLGMMIIQRILRDHGAHIGIDSKPNAGTVITLQFPQKHRRVRLLSE